MTLPPEPSTVAQTPGFVPMNTSLGGPPRNELVSPNPIPGNRTAMSAMADATTAAVADTRDENFLTADHLLASLVGKLEASSSRGTRGTTWESSRVPAVAVGRGRSNVQLTER